MTAALKAQDVAKQVAGVAAGAVISADGNTLVVEPKYLFNVAEFLKNEKGLEFNYLSNLTAVDYLDYFEVVYHLNSMVHNHSIILKVKLHSRGKPFVASVVSLWRAADYQEREIYDLMGIVFEGHPNLKRLFLWEEFEGHPLRRDYL
jgi:NADH-quinone oxidoreductase subunit C